MCVAIPSLVHAKFVVITIFENYCSCAVYALENLFEPISLIHFLRCSLSTRLCLLIPYGFGNL